MDATAEPALPSRTGLLDELARLAPHFALETHPADSVPPGRWRPFAELLDDLAGRIAVVRAALAAATGGHPAQVELRVAVSMTQLGLTGRLVCPALGVAVLTGGLLDLDPARLRWQPGPGNAVALSVPAQAIAGCRPATAGPDLAALADTVLAGPVRAAGRGKQPVRGVTAGAVGQRRLGGARRPGPARRRRAGAAGPGRRAGDRAVEPATVARHVPGPAQGRVPAAQLLPDLPAGTGRFGSSRRGGGMR